MKCKSQTSLTLLQHLHKNWLAKNKKKQNTLLPQEQEALIFAFLLTHLKISSQANYEYCFKSASVPINLLSPFSEINTEVIKKLKKIEKRSRITGFYLILKTNFTCCALICCRRRAQLGLPLSLTASKFSCLD